MITIKHSDKLGNNMNMTFRSLRHAKQTFKCLECMKSMGKVCVYAKEPLRFDKV
jgi:hypothetical protein